MAESEDYIPTTSDLIKQFKAFNLDVNRKDNENEMKGNACTKMINASLKAKYGADISKRTDSVFTILSKRAGK